MRLLKLRTMNFRVINIATLILCAVHQIKTDDDDGVKDEVKDEAFHLQEIQNLVHNVCYDLFIPEDEISTCKKNFLDSTTAISAEPLNLQFTCRTPNKVKFTIEKMDTPQLVVLVPDEEDEYSYSTVTRAGSEDGIVDYIPEEYNYTFWATSLYKNYSHGIWRKGAVLPPYNANFVTTVQGPTFEFVKERNNYTVIFIVDVVGELSECTVIDVTNMCKQSDQGNFFHDVYEDGNNTNRRTLEISIKNLMMNDDCTFYVSVDNIINAQTIKYIIPTPNNTQLPELIGNVTLDAVPTVTGWDITVGWEKPKGSPLRYNITLYTLALTESAENVSGDAIKYTFKDVPEGWKEEEYHVDIESVYLNGTAHKTGLKGWFPPRPSYKAVIITGSWSVVLTLLSAVLALFIWWRRRRMSLFRNHFILEPDEFDKLPKEIPTEMNQEPAMQDAWELPSDKLMMHEVIGEGAFGVVRRGILAPGGKAVAVKMLKDYPTLEELRSFRAEMELMKSVGVHAHIVSLVGCCSGRRPLIIAEYCSKGDLLTFLRRSWDVMVSKRNAKYYNNNFEEDYRNDLFKKPKEGKYPPLVINKLYDIQGVCDPDLTPSDLLSFCRQIAKGMEFLASNRVVHRDLAARNVLVTSNRTLKIADFGLSRDVYQENQYKQKGNGKMPVKWMALESLTHRMYTTQSDVWSFGVVVWEIVTVGGAPYPEVSTSKLPRLLKAGYRMPRPNNCSDQLYSLMLSCWHARPRERPTFAELHQSLDELLARASADQYISLELDYQYQPPSALSFAPTFNMSKYIPLILRGNRVFVREENYQRPLKGFQSNHYSTPPHSANIYQTGNLFDKWQSVTNPC